MAEDCLYAVSLERRSSLDGNPRFRRMEILLDRTVPRHFESDRGKRRSNEQCDTRLGKITDQNRVERRGLDDIEIDLECDRRTRGNIAGIDIHR